MNALFFPFFSLPTSERFLSGLKKKELRSINITLKAARYIYHRLLFPTTTVAASAFNTLHTNATLITPPSVAGTTPYQLVRGAGAQNESCGSWW